ncbi:MAG: porin [Synechococcaceae bacterium WB9_2_112]|nr:porin [Synechococcaceae bacterium WB9_2_112]
MKLFKQLLVAPAALGLVAPLAVSAQEIASLNGMSAVNEYMNQQDVDRFRAWESKNQVTSVTQFSDVRPTDWAYQALTNLIDKYGCVAGYPNGTYKGGQAMTRFEAAALLNACLDRVTEQTDEFKRLLDEFQQELTVLRGRVDGLEKKVGKLEAMQFSTTTKLQGEATMVLGGVGYSAAGPNNTVLGAAAGTAARDAVSFNYDLRLNLNTSFTGKDLLYTRLRSGNFGGSAFGGSPIGMDRLDKSSSDLTNNAQQNVFIDRLYYRFPIGTELTATIGPRVRNTEMVSFRPQAYNADILDFFTLAGAPGAYNKATGTGFGIEWKQNVKKGQPYLVASANYVAQNGQNANPNSSDVTAAGGGLFNAYSGSNMTVQLGGRGTNWGVAALYRYGTCGTNLRDGTPMAASSVACGPANAGSTNSLGLGAFWQPKQTGWIPSISLGWGYTGFSQSVAVTPNQVSVNNVSAAQSWSAMFQWDDAFAKGNSAGFALGQGAFATALRNGTNPNDSNFAFEWFYRFRVSNNITVTPAIFYLSNPNGQQATGSNAFNNTGFLVQTQFKF